MIVVLVVWCTCRASEMVINLLCVGESGCSVRRKERRINGRRGRRWLAYVCSTAPGFCFSIAISITIMSTTTVVQTENRASDEHLPNHGGLQLTAASGEMSTGNPANWPTEFRRVPPYRPVNRNLDRSERPNGSNPVEAVVANIMLQGVQLQSVSGLVRAFFWYGPHGMM